jgi:hypothetical protein
VDSFVKDIGHSACIPLEDLSIRELCKEIDRAMEHGKDYAAEAGRILREAETINGDAVRRLLAKGRTTSA